MKAISVECQTCLGALFPKDEDGPCGVNCFSVKSDDGKTYRIVNFYVENLNRLIDKKGLTWPVECKVLGPKTAIIHDPRIGERWYNKNYCEICCPKELLPCNQRDIHERDIMRGRRQERSTGTINCVSIDGSKKAEIE